MTVEEANYFWKFTQTIMDDSLVKCPVCKQAFPLAQWTEGPSYCETCGEHAAMVCPNENCREYIDWVWHKEPLEVVVWHNELHS